MDKKDIIFIATALMMSSQKASAPTNETMSDQIRSSYLKWYHLLSEIYEEIPTDPQK